MKKNISNWTWGALLVCIAVYMLSVVLAGCRDKPTVKPHVVVDTLKWYCTPIAPMKDVTTAVGQKGKFWPVGATIKIGFLSLRLEDYGGCWYG